MKILHEPDTPLDLRKVAEAAGKSRTAPYLVFGKESEGGGLLGLRIAVAAEGARLMEERMQAAAHSSADPLTAFRNVAAAFLGFVDEHPRLFRLMYGPEISIVPRLGAEGFLNHGEFRELLARRAKAGDVITDIIVECQNQGLLPPDPDDDSEAMRIAALGDGAGAGVWGATADGVIDPRGEYPSLRYTLVAWASMIGVALLRLDEVLAAIRLDIPIDQGARIVTEAVFGLDPTPVAGAARMFLAAQQVEGSSAPTSGKPIATRLSAPPPLRARSHDHFHVAEDSVAALYREQRGEPNAPLRDLASGPARAFGRLFRREGPSGSAATPEPEERPKAVAASAAPEAMSLTQTLAAHYGFRRATQSATALRGAPILWIDDRPHSIDAEVGMLRLLGGRVDVATGSAEALEMLSAASPSSPYRVIISDIEREGRPDEGVQALEQLHALAPGAPVVFYVSRLSRERGVPVGAYGITDSTDELMHLVMDVLEGR